MHRFPWSILEWVFNCFISRSLMPLIVIEFKGIWIQISPSVFIWIWPRWTQQEYGFLLLENRDHLIHNALVIWYHVDINCCHAWLGLRKTQPPSLTVPFCGQKIITRYSHTCFLDHNYSQNKAKHLIIFNHL